MNWTRKSTHNFISYSSSLISPSALNGHLLWTRPNAGPAYAEIKGLPLPWRDFNSFCLFLLLSTGTKLPTPQSMFHTYVSEDPRFKGFKIKQSKFSKLMFMCSWGIGKRYTVIEFSQLGWGLSFQNWQVFFNSDTFQTLRNVAIKESSWIQKANRTFSKDWLL